MSHEKSITVERDGRYFVLDNSGSNKGRTLGPSIGFSTQQQANSFARQRSRSIDPKTHTRRVIKRR